MQENNHNVTLDDLATMVRGGGFDDLGERMKKGFEDVGNETVDLKKGQKALEEGQEAIQLRLGNVPYRFEFTELQKRIEVLEKR